MPHGEWEGTDSPTIVWNSKRLCEGCGSLLSSCSSSLVWGSWIGVDPFLQPPIQVLISEEGREAMKECTEHSLQHPGLKSWGLLTNISSPFLSSGTFLPLRTSSRMKAHIEEKCWEQRIAGGDARAAGSIYGSGPISISLLPITTSLMPDLRSRIPGGVP